ncbi:hypothetical protein OPV22_005413 [Ensete ventricosum]|uniref:DUF834 domain-containing protein n=1 Tax=Ensete ventricosum TaxID=4639 RepID=A0AAV8RJ20_ENSVE|nr:hypothetical protein OPV22_005413 [Ensete ventricosum]
MAAIRAASRRQQQRGEEEGATTGGGEEKGWQGLWPRRLRLEGGCGSEKYVRKRGGQRWAEAAAKATTGEMGKNSVAEAARLGAVGDRWALKRRKGIVVASDSGREEDGLRWQSRARMGVAGDWATLDSIVGSNGGGDAGEGRCG